MQDCQTPREENLQGVVHLRLQGPHLDLERAKEASRHLAHTYASNPELVSWYDGKEKTFFPEGECCTDEKPDCLEYARSRGGNLTVEVNDMEYVFVYRGVQGLQ